ncbi:MAG: type I-Fv CRISPR-associated protein Cas5fv [Methylicorpusculum sp.]|uniref:type I-Fv CRISPR-associated protein Cas5fv n=1 Tax=Methylicorpusculum sp. TaxID=2713644 RepID=UPI00271C4471|nr:type I-Fv CRISPR-associated protein Cas5fv [Methylicorpusculum sp.]MDO8939541.1 type I-Fv CRISPR-associated protein Cas5fv [Methylicorpusculum sp.]MDP2204555.1 type I-Fv CRISPR-associated protein Cas5fv [Methylicorpusculum sp.]
MRITIKYEAAWQNSFLDGSNNEPLPKDGRGFVGSMTNLKKLNSEGKYSNFIQREISHDTVMGVLNRLIGDQRKLYQAKNCPNYFFAELENSITFENIHDHSKPINKEIVYIRNITGSTDQNSFTGMIKGNHPVFNSAYSSEFWGVLWLSLDQLFCFFEENSYSVKLEEYILLDPLIILARSNDLKELKPIDSYESIGKTVEYLKGIFPDQNYVESSGKINPIRLYAAALYIQLDRLSKRFDMKDACNRRGSNQYVYGYSKRGFNGPRDFMKNFITGEEKTIWGNPYLLKEKRKGEGEVTSLLTKANGVLEIHLDIAQEKALQLKDMIEAAGVSSFYMGKKGLAYVDGLRI